MERWDLIIVGGGPAGLSTALHLCRLDPAWAARILILEKARYPRHKLCGGGITEYGLRCLSGLGLDIAEVPRVPIDELRMVRGRHRASFHSGHGLTIFRRDAFDAWLAQKVLAAGVRLSQGETVSRLETTKGGVQVTTDRGSYLARALVAADGSNGICRRQLGAADLGRVGRAIELLTPVRGPLDEALFSKRVAVFDFSPAPADLQGYYWDFPCWVDGRPHINRGVYDARTAPERPRADLKAILAGCLAEREIDIASCELMGHPIRWFEPTLALSQPHVLYAGDSAGADPLLGEGIAFALGYGGVAADTLAAAFRARDFRFEDYAARLRASEYGQILEDRVRQAKQLYRHRHPLLLPTFMPNSFVQRRSGTSDRGA